MSSAWGRCSMTKEARPHRTKQMNACFWLLGHKFLTCSIHLSLQIWWIIAKKTPNKTCCIQQAGEVLCSNWRDVELPLLSLLLAVCAWRENMSHGHLMRHGLWSCAFVGRDVHETDLTNTMCSEMPNRVRHGSIVLGNQFHCCIRALAVATPNFKDRRAAATAAALTVFGSAWLQKSGYAPRKAWSGS